MVVIRRTDGDRVDLVAKLFEQLPIVGISFGILERPRLLGAFKKSGIGVADSDHLSVHCGVAGVASPLPGNTNAAELNLLIGGAALLRGDAAGYPEPQARG